MSKRPRAEADPELQLQVMSQMALHVTHVYKYKSSKHGEGTIMLHHTNDEAGTSTVEFLKNGMLSDSHGHWSTDECGALRITFNCRAGVRLPTHGDEWPLHPSVMWREPDTANWWGFDDKQAEIKMEHCRSLRVTHVPGQRATTEIIDAL